MIEVVREDPEPSSFEVENCCFCRRSTPFWYREKDVAVCVECAGHASPEDVPDKETWCRRERIAGMADTITSDENELLRQLLVDADEVARQRGDTYGLCDAIDNSGNPYQSAYNARLLDYIKSEGVKPMLSLDDIFKALIPQEKEAHLNGA